MGRIVGDCACPQCREQGGDRTGNHLLLFEDGGGFCNRCGYVHRSTDAPLTPNPVVTKSAEEIAEEMRSASELEVMGIPKRSIDLDVSQRFGFRVGVNKRSGDHNTVLFPRYTDGVLTGYKVKGLNKWVDENGKERKLFYHVGNARGTDLVGLREALGGDTYKGKLWITEDDLSMASVYQTLMQFTKQEHKNIKPAVIALPDGSDEQGSKVAHLFEKHRNELAQFKEIIMVLDNDEAGIAGAEMARKLFPEKVKVVENLPLKDPNDMVMAKRNYELNTIVRFEAKQKSPDGAVSAVELIELSLEPPKMGLTMPWEGIFNMTCGQRWHEMTTIGGGSGLGKSTVGYELAAWNIMEHKQRVGAFFLEEQPVKALRYSVSKVAGWDFNNPRIPFNKELYLPVANDLAPYLELWDNRGVNDWDNIYQAMRWWHLTKGTNVFLVDNITAMVSHLSSGEMNTEIGRISKEVASFCNEYPVHVYIFSHLNAPKQGKSHEEGAEGKASQLTGSRHLQRYSHNIWMFERNAHAEGDARNIGKIRVVKNREFGETGWTGVKYDPATTRLTESNEEMVEAEMDSDNPFA